MTGEVFRLHVLPAGIGDALVLDYGTETDLHRVVIDGGVGQTAQPLADFLGPTPQLELRAVQEANLDPAAPVAEEPLRPPGRLERMGAPDLLQLAAERTPEDNKEANGSSIAILATWAERTALLTGDAHSDVLLETLDRWLGPDGTLEVDLFKLPHHGSRANVTDALMKRVRAKCYVFSSSGQGRSQHPNDPAVARVIVNSTGDRLLVFNYLSKRTELWQDPAIQAQWGYRTRYPTGSEGIVIDLLDL